MLRRLTDPSTLQYMSCMPISLHRVMIARWQCRPEPAETERERLKHKYAHNTTMMEHRGGQYNIFIVVYVLTVLSKLVSLNTNINLYSAD